MAADVREFKSGRAANPKSFVRLHNIVFFYNNGQLIVVSAYQV
jgi:hypothetical protein